MSKRRPNSNYHCQSRPHLYDDGGGELPGGKHNKDPEGCTLCGLCVDSCSLGVLRVIESAVETALTLNLAQCIGCNRCVRTCPEEVLYLSHSAQTKNRFDLANRAGYRVMRQSSRAGCPNCGRPTVSQADLKAVFARLQPDPVMQQLLSLCIACKSYSI